MKPYLISALGLAAAGALAYALWPSPPEPLATLDTAPATALAQVRLPDALSTDAQAGQRSFDAVCAACHGANAAGVDGAGPPLVHKIYEPSHHGDMAFQLAARQGVRAHHWRFGNMPPQPQVTSAEVEAIIAYVRELQRANGIN